MSMVPVATGLNGTAAALTKRERYQVTLDADGHPALLFNGACSGGSCFNIVQAFAKTDDGGSRLSAKSDDERSQGQTFFVDPDGDDSAAGTSAGGAGGGASSSGMPCSSRICRRRTRASQNAAVARRWIVALRAGVVVCGN